MLVAGENRGARLHHDYGVRARRGPIAPGQILRFTVQPDWPLGKRARLPYPKLAQRGDYSGRALATLRCLSF